MTSTRTESAFLPCTTNFSRGDFPAKTVAKRHSRMADFIFQRQSSAVRQEKNNEPSFDHQHTSMIPFWNRLFLPDFLLRPGSLSRIPILSRASAPPVLQFGEVGCLSGSTSPSEGEGEEERRFSAERRERMENRITKSQSLSENI